MRRRQFLASCVAIVAAPMLPAILPAPVLPTIYMSPEALEDIRNWGVDQVDEQTRKELYAFPEGDLTESCMFYGDRKLWVDYGS